MLTLVAADDGWVVVRAATAAAGVVLGDRLNSAYAIGSLAHGGFSAAVSDVDLALLTERVVEQDAISSIGEDVAEKLGTDLSRRLSVFHVPWRTFAAPPIGSRFPALDRLDLVCHGVPIAGVDVRVATPAPARAEVITEAVGFALERLQPASVTAALRRPSLGELGLREATKLVLLPIRLLFVACTGRADSNEDAAAYYREKTGESQLELAGAALGWRQAGSFGDRVVAERLMRTQLLPLQRQVLAMLGDIPGLPMRHAIVACARSYESLGSAS